MSRGLVTRTRSLLAIAVCAFAVASPSRAEPVEGRDYSRLTAPQAPETQGKIEVIEFFSWGCPHCDHLYPLITKWAAQLPANVQLVKVPVSMGHPQWGQLVRAYYSLQATGDLTRLEGALFDAIHREKQTLFDEESITDWVAQHGVDRAKFTAAYNSLNVSTRSSHAEKLSRDYQVQGIPQIVVAGKFQVLGNDYNQMLTNATQVIELAGKAPK